MGVRRGRMREKVMGDHSRSDGVVLALRRLWSGGMGCRIRGRRRSWIGRLAGWSCRGELMAIGKLNMWMGPARWRALTSASLRAPPFQALRGRKQQHQEYKRKGYWAGRTRRADLRPVATTAMDSELLPIISECLSDYEIRSPSENRPHSTDPTKPPPRPPHFCLCTATNTLALHYCHASPADPPRHHPRVLSTRIHYKHMKSNRIEVVKKRRKEKRGILKGDKIFRAQDNHKPRK